MLVKEVLEKSNQFLKSKGIESSRLDAELIISHILKMERISLYLKYDQPLTEEETNVCRQKIMERAKGFPVAYILNKKYFYNYEFFVNSSVLIPRPETEILVEEVLIWVKQKELSELSFLDLGTGSGCISISLVAELIKKQIKLKKVVAIDISKSAIEVAKINTKKILPEVQTIDFLVTDAGEFKSDALFDFIVANPPYIAMGDPSIQKSVSDFEPHQALFAADNGLRCIKNWNSTASRLLKPGGFVIFEIGCNQGVEGIKIFSDSGVYSSIELIRDFSGLDRFIKAVKNG